MKVLCTKKAFHKGEIWREGEVYDYPGDTPPGYAFKILTEKDVKDERKKQAEEAAASNEDKAKEKLIADASRLGIGAPSTLARWGVDRLEKAIAEARE
jgi:hypothetical protein